jgi:hypothetical protein
MRLKILRILDQFLRPHREDFFRGERREKDPVIASFEEKYGFFSPHPLVGRVTSTEKDINYVCQALEQAQNTFSFWELFSKALSYRELQVGMEIPSPLGWLRVNRCFDYKGLVAFGLIPTTSNQLVLLFRGTDLSFSRKGLYSLYANCDPKSWGFSLFQRVRPILGPYLQQFEELLVVGYSLGGLLASYLVVYEGSRFPRLSAFSFNPPGVYKRLFKKIGKKKETEKIITYITVGDLISKVGHLLGQVHDLTFDHSLGPITAHTALFTGQTHFLHKR